jgi:hypothetical protein
MTEENKIILLVVGVFTLTFLVMILFVRMQA